MFLGNATHTHSLDRSGGSVFSNLLGPAKVEHLLVCLPVLCAAPLMLGVGPLRYHNEVK